MISSKFCRNWMACSKPASAAIWNIECPANDCARVTKRRTMNGRTWGAMASTIFGLLAALFSLDLEGRPHAATITAIGTPALSTAETQDDLGRLVNPHSDLIFRVTDATSCRDCHAPVKGSPE